MKPGAYFILLLLAVACVGMTVALILVQHINQKLQVELQARQQMLNQGILGQQAQQISGGVIQDMATAAVKSRGIRVLLEKNGYRASPPRSDGSAKNSPVKKQEEPMNTEESKP
jgi:DNA-binding protein H-NS